MLIVVHQSIVHTENCKNDFLMLGEGPTDINYSLGFAEQRFSINFTKAKPQFCLSLHYNSDNDCLFVSGIEIYNFKSNNRRVNLPNQFFLGSISNLSQKTMLSQEKYHLKEMFMIFQSSMLLLINQT